MALKLSLFLSVFSFSAAFWLSHKPQIQNDVLDPTYKIKTVATSAAKSRNWFPIEIKEKVQVHSLRQFPKESQNRKPDKHLIDNWNLNDSGLPPDGIAPFFEENQPESIVYYRDDKLIRIYPDRYGAGDDQSDQVLFIGSEKSIKNTAEERRERSSAFANWDQENSDQADLIQLPKNAYEIVEFRPGKRDNGETLKSVATDLLSSLQGPDYSFENIRPSDDGAMRRILSRVLSLGHGGELVVGIKNNGFILDEPGFDFSIFENAFRIAGTKLIFQEFAYVGVSESNEPSSFRWFSCEPLSGILRGCAGAVPTTEGGDQFDLAELGLKKISYIWIKDTRKNKNFPSKWPTEGVDLDAMRLNHAYREK